MMYTEQERQILTKAIRNPTDVQTFVVQNEAVYDALRVLLDLQKNESRGDEIVDMGRLPRVVRLVGGEGQQAVLFDLARENSVNVAMTGEGAERVISLSVPGYKQTVTVEISG